MKKVLIFLSLIMSWLSRSQTNPLQDIKTSPNGYFDTVLDRFGNQYKLKDLKIANRDYAKSGVISCDSGIFELYYEIGSGMEDPNNTTHNDRRAVVCRVFKDISDFINTPLKNAGNTTKVKIWVRNPANIGMPSNALGAASSFYTMPYNSVTNFGGIIDGEVFKTIQGGKDSFVNVASPLVNTNGSASSGNYYHGMMAFNFNLPSPKTWNINLLASTITLNEYDLYSVVLHEVTHALGFNSLLNYDGNSVFGSGYKYYTRYDRFLKNSSNSQFLLTNTGACSLYNYGFNGSASVLVPGCTATPPTSTTSSNTTNCSTAIRFVGTNNTAVYTPNCFEQGSSYSHFEDMCIASPNNDGYFAMSNAINTGIIKRFLKLEERNALQDIGYSLSMTYGNNSLVDNSYISYTNPTLTALDVEGINDGISSNGAYTFVGSAGVPISITGILGNDYNATSFECLQDVFDTSAILSSTSGTSSTTINFSSNVFGLHLLRYVPINNQGKKGNITYVFVYISESNSCGTPTACDFVINGDFEQHNGLPTNSSQLNGIVCGWNTVHTDQSSEYYHTNSTLVTPNLKVPCNIFGYETDNKNGNAYVGMYIRAYSDPFNESVRTKLKSPLLPNTTYQLSFDVSLAEGAAIDAQKCQAYLSPDLVIPSGYGYIPISNPNMLFTKATHSTITNGWDHIVFTFTTGATSGEEYLYVGGGLTSASGPSIFPLPAPTQIPDCVKTPMGAPYYYLDNVSLIPLNGSILDLPAQVCNSVTLSNLTIFLTATPNNGVFSGTGVVNTNGTYSFNATTAGVGTHTITYTYTNSSGCQVSISDSIQVVNTNIIVPTFNQIAPICAGSNLQSLPTTSINNITGTWSPALNNQVTTTYTFTPNSSQCTSPTLTTMTITVLPASDPSCPANNCPASLTFTTTEGAANATYQASNTIVTNTNYLVNAGSTITLKAGNSITFSPSSEVKANSSSNFTAQIAACSPSARMVEELDKDLTEQKLSNEFVVYPNPTKDNLTLEIRNDKISRILITTLEGKIVFEKLIEETNSHQLDISSYQNGLYMLNVETIGGQRLNRKIIKN